MKKVADGYKAKKEIMLAFLPVSANAEGDKDPEQIAVFEENDGQLSLFPA